MVLSLAYLSFVSYFLAWSVCLGLGLWPKRQWMPTLGLFLSWLGWVFQTFALLLVWQFRVPGGLPTDWWFFFFFVWLWTALVLVLQVEFKASLVVAFGLNLSLITLFPLILEKVPLAETNIQAPFLNSHLLSSVAYCCFLTVGALMGIQRLNDPRSREWFVFGHAALSLFFLTLAGLRIGGFSFTHPHFGDVKYGNWIFWFTYVLYALYFVRQCGSSRMISQMEEKQEETLDHVLMGLGAFGTFLLATLFLLYQSQNRILLLLLIAIGLSSFSMIALLKKSKIEVPENSLQGIEVRLKKFTFLGLCALGVVMTYEKVGVLWQVPSQNERSPSELLWGLRDDLYWIIFLLFWTYGFWPRSSQAQRSGFLPLLFVILGCACVLMSLSGLKG